MIYCWADAFSRHLNALGFLAQHRVQFELHGPRLSTALARSPLQALHSDLGSYAPVSRPLVRATAFASPLLVPHGGELLAGLLVDVLVAHPEAANWGPASRRRKFRHA